MDEKKRKKKIVAYDKQLAKRLEDIRKQNKFTQEKMAEYMDVSLGQYKRYIYCESKIPAEKLVVLIEKLHLDPDYVLFGRTTSRYDFIRFVENASYGDLAELFMELSSMYSKKERANGIDYVTKDGNLIEKHKR